MPGLARKLLICAAADGLLVHPVGARGQPDGKSVRIEYQTNKISSATRSDNDGDEEKDSGSVEAHGIIGRNISYT